MDRKIKKKKGWVKVSYKIFLGAKKNLFSTRVLKPGDVGLKAMVTPHDASSGLQCAIYIQYITELI